MSIGEGISFSLTNCMQVTNCSKGYVVSKFLAANSLSSSIRCATYLYNDCAYGEEFIRLLGLYVCKMQEERLEYQIGVGRLTCIVIPYEIAGKNNPDNSAHNQLAVLSTDEEGHVILCYL